MRILLCLFPLMLAFCWTMVQGGGGGGGGLEDMKQMEHALPYENSNNRRTHGAKPKGTGRTHSGTKQKSSYQASGSASNSSAYSTARGTGSSGYYSYYTGTGDCRYSYRRSGDSRRKSGDERRSGDRRKSGGGQRGDSRQFRPRSLSQGRRSGSRQSDYDSKWFGGSRTSQYSRYSEMQATGDKATRSMWKIEIKPEEFAELLRVIGIFLASNGLGVDKAYTEKELAVNMQASGRQSFLNLLEPSGANKTIKEAIKAAFGAIAEGGGQTGNPQIEGIKSMLSCWTLALLVINCMSAVGGGEMASQLSRMHSQRSMMPPQMSGMPNQMPGMPSQMPTNQPINPDMIRQRLEIAKKRSQEIDMLIQGKKNVAAISDAQVIIINILNDKIGDNFITNTCTKNVTMKEGRATSSYYSGGASTTRATDGSYYSSTYTRSDSRRRSGSRNSKGREGNKSTDGGIIGSIASAFGRRKSSSGRERSGTRERGSDSTKYRRESSRETGKEGRPRSSSKVRERSGGRGESSRHYRTSSRNDRERDGRRKSDGKTNSRRKSGGGERGTRKSGSGGDKYSSYGKSGYSGYYTAYSSSHSTRKNNSGGRTSRKSGDRRKSGH